MNINLTNFDSIDVDAMQDGAKTISEMMNVLDLKKSVKKKPLPLIFKEIKDINHMSFGHFIILEQILTSQKDDGEKIKLAAHYLIRPANEKLLDNENEKVEEEHKESINALDIGIITGVIDRYLIIRKEYLFKTYNGVLYEMLDEDDKDEDEIKEGSAESARAFHNKKFFWYSLIGVVCGNDIFKRNNAVNLPMYEVMPFLAEKRSLEIVERLESKTL